MRYHHEPKNGGYRSDAFAPDCSSIALVLDSLSLATFQDLLQAVARAAPSKTTLQKPVRRVRLS